MAKKTREIPKKKLKEVEKLVELIKEKKTILIASIKNIPSSQFQEISKKLRGKAMIKVPKKNLIFRAIDSSGKEAVKQVKDKITESVAILFSDLNTFDLAAELVKNKSPTKAKAGQEAPEDIEIQEGPTELVPGPAISELGSLGIQVQIEKGKIHIKESKVIVKKGGKISREAAQIMNKLDIKPFSIGFDPLCAFDTEEGKLYLEIKIDKEGALQDIKRAFSKALAFAVEVGYVSDNTISFLISKAVSHEKALSNLIKEGVSEEKKEVSKDNSKEVKEEKNAAKAEDNKQLSEKTEDKSSKGGDNSSQDNSEPLGEANTQSDKSQEDK